MPRYYEAHRSHLTLISAVSVHGKRGTKFSPPKIRPSIHRIEKFPPHCRVIVANKTLKPIIIILISFLNFYITKIIRKYLSSLNFSNSKKKKFYCTKCGKKVRQRNVQKKNNHKFLTAQFLSQFLIKRSIMIHE